MSGWHVEPGRHGNVIIRDGKGRFIAQDVPPPDAESIAASRGAAGELAALQEIVEAAERLKIYRPAALVGDVFRCQFCGATASAYPMDHEPDCPWLALGAAIRKRERLAAASPTTPDAPCDLCGEPIEDHETWTLAEDGKGHQFRTHDGCAIDAAHSCTRCAARWPARQQVTDLLDLIHEHGSAELIAMADEAVGGAECDNGCPGCSRCSSSPLDGRASDARGGK